MRIPTRGKAKCATPTAQIQVIQRAKKVPIAPPAVKSLE